MEMEPITIILAVLFFYSLWEVFKAKRKGEYPKATFHLVEAILILLVAKI